MHLVSGSFNLFFSRVGKEVLETVRSTSPKPNIRLPLCFDHVDIKQNAHQLYMLPRSLSEPQN